MKPYPQNISFLCVGALLIERVTPADGADWEVC